VADSTGVPDPARSSRSTGPPAPAGSPPIPAPPVPAEPASEPPAPSEPPRKKFKFPTAFTVLAAVLILVWIASFFVPAGIYTTNAATGASMPGMYHKLPSCSAVEAGDAALVVDSPGEAGGSRLSPTEGDHGPCPQSPRRR
jgi:hypothetical protein